MQTMLDCLKLQKHLLFIKELFDKIDAANISLLSHSHSRLTIDRTIRKGTNLFLWLVYVTT